MSETDSQEESIEIAEVERRIDDQLAQSFHESLVDRIYSSPFELPIYVLGVIFFAYHIWYAYSLPLSRGQHAVIHLGLVLMFWGMLNVLRADRSTVQGKLATVGYTGYALLSTVPFYYMFNNYRELQISAGNYSQIDIQVGVLIIVLLLIALWSVSRLIFGVVILGLVYSYFGQYMPGLIQHRGLSVERIITMNTVELQGIFGTLLQVVATWVVMFVILSAIIEKYGGMATFVKGITRFSSRHRIQIGQIAVLSSMVFGSINGATTANVATTGSFTIPLMKQNGYPARLAAALESVASCGGQVLPPVMGTSAFIMAELIQPDYATIVTRAIIPALLFYFTVFWSIELYVRKYGNIGELTQSARSSSKLTQVRDILGHYEYLGMLIVLIYFLIVIQSDPMLAGFYSIAVLAGLSFVRFLYEGTMGEDDLSNKLRRFARENVEGFRRGVEAMMGITIMVAALGIVVRAFIVTGFAQTLSTQLILLSGGNVVLIVIMAALASIIFGMGMPTVAAYLLVALFVAPPLGEALAVGPLAVHMFVFYFAIVSNITPPIAVAVVIAQGIADSEFLDTTVDALKMGFPMFLLPFVFIFSDEILAFSPMTILVAVIVGTGFVSISIGFIGYDDISMPVKAGFIVTGLGAVFTPWFVGQVIFVALVVGGLMYLNFGRPSPRKGQSDFS